MEIVISGSSAAKRKETQAPQWTHYKENNIPNQNREVLERLRIAFTVNGKREIRVYVFLGKQAHR